MDAPRAESALRDLEAAALAEEQVRCGHAHILEHDLGMTVRRIVVTEYRQGAEDAHTRCVARDHDHRLPPMPVSVGGVGLAHDDENLAGRAVRARQAPPS